MCREHSSPFIFIIEWSRARWLASSTFIDPSKTKATAPEAASQKIIKFLLHGICINQCERSQMLFAVAKGGWITPNHDAEINERTFCFSQTHTQLAPFDRIMESFMWIFFVHLFLPSINLLIFLIEHFRSSGIDSFCCYSFFCSVGRSMWDFCCL